MSKIRPKMATAVTKRTMVGLLALVAVLSATAPAVADKAGVTAAPTPATPHCVTDLDTGREACASSLDEASEHLGTLASYRVLIVYQLPNFGGESHAWVKASSCTTSTTDSDISVRDLRNVPFPGGGNWSERISSLETDVDADTRCSVVLYQHPNYDGYDTTFHHNTPDLRDWSFPTGGTWDNRVSSLVIT